MVKSFIFRNCSHRIIFILHLVLRFRLVLQEYCILSVCSYKLSIRSSLTFVLVMSYVRKVQKTHLGLDVNDSHQALCYADNVSLTGDIRTIERNAEVLLNACKDIDLAVNTVKTKYKEAGHHQGLMANGHSR